MAELKICDEVRSSKKVAMPFPALGNDRFGKLAMLVVLALFVIKILLYIQLLNNHQMKDASNLPILFNIAMLDHIGKGSFSTGTTVGQKNNLGLLSLSNSSASSNLVPHALNSAPAGDLDQRNATEAFFLGDMDLASRLDCGLDKCFVPSTSNQEMGYLVRVLRNTKDLAYLTGAWNTAKWINNQLGGLHFYIDPPFKAKLNKGDLDKFSSVTYKTNEGKHHAKFFEKCPSPCVIGVQKVKKAPVDSLYIACHEWNIARYWKGIGGFVLKIMQSGNATEFMRNSKESYNIAEKMFQTEPSMLTDFQALFDMEGRLFFIDLDGHLVWDYFGVDKNTQGNCLENIDKVRRRVKEKMKGSSY